MDKDEEITEPQDETVIPERVEPYRNRYRRVNEKDEADTSNDEQPDAATHSKEPAEELQPEEKTYRKRYGDLKSHYDRTVGELRTRIRELEVTNAQATSLPETPPASEEDMKEFKKKYPEAYRMMKAISRLEKDKDLSALRQEVETLKGANQQTTLEKTIMEIKRAHADFDELKNNDDFHDWLKEQDEELQGWIYNNSSKARLAIRAIDLYKIDRGYKTKDKEKAKASANADAALEVSPRSKTQTERPGKKIWSMQEISRLSNSQFEKYEDEIDLARKENRIRN